MIFNIRLSDKHTCLILSDMQWYKNVILSNVRWYLATCGNYTNRISTGKYRLINTPRLEWYPLADLANKMKANLQRKEEERGHHIFFKLFAPDSYQVKISVTMIWIYILFYILAYFKSEDVIGCKWILLEIWCLVSLPLFLYSKFAFISFAWGIQYEWVRMYTQVLQR